jgi:hypothetical protein
MKAKYLGFMAAVLLLLQYPVGARQISIGQDQRYVLLEILKVGTFEAELNDAGRQGFRLKMSATNGARIMAMMERAGKGETFQYKIVATFTQKTGDKEMNTAAAEGYRMVPHTYLVKQSMNMFSTDTVVIMEREAKPSTFYEYKTISGFKATTIDREIKLATTDGWQAHDMLYYQILMERPKR